MIKFIPVVLAAISLGLAGCDNKSKSGGPGVTADPEKRDNVVAQADNTFSLDMPNLATKVKQGETKSVAIGIKRGKNFDGDVTLRFDGQPTGVTFTPAGPVIKSSEKEVQVSVAAAETASIGDYSVKVHGVPASGATATNEFKITVDKK